MEFAELNLIHQPWENGDDLLRVLVETLAEALIFSREVDLHLLYTVAHIDDDYHDYYYEVENEIQPNPFLF